jgi:hypothetical protein
MTGAVLHDYHTSSGRPGLAAGFTLPMAISSAVTMSPSASACEAACVADRHRRPPGRRRAGGPRARRGRSAGGLRGADRGGRAEIEAINAQREADMERLTASFSDDELRALARLVGKLMQAL